VTEAMARDQRIGMIQPSGPGEPPPLFSVGCVGRISEIEALEDGRFNIILEGESRFRVRRELEVTTMFRQLEVELFEEDGGEPGSLSSIERAALEEEARAFATSLGYTVEWSAVEKLDDEMLVNAIAQIAPFDTSAKQALLEAPDLPERTDMIIQLMQFARRGDAPGSQRLH
jgi:Lon protease-like protein